MRAVLDLSETRLPGESAAQAWDEEVAGLDVPGPVPCAPLLLDRALYEDLFHATRALMALIVRAVLQSGPDTAARMRALEADPADYPLLTDDPDEYAFAGCMARPDVVIEDGCPRFLKIGVGGGVGGTVETEAMQRAWARAYAEEGLEPPLAYGALDARAQLYDRACEHRGADRAVALVGNLLDLGEATSRHYEMEVEHLRALGFDAEWLEPQDLEAALGLPGRPRYGVGLRCFTISGSRRHGVDLAPVAAAQDAGCLLLAPQAASLLDDERTLAWISEGRGCRTAEERRLVARYVPWTRVAEPGSTTWRGERRDLEAVALAHQDELVLKGTNGTQGERATIGRRTPAGRWEREVRAALERRDGILQAYVEPDRAALGCATDAFAAPGEDRVAPVLSPLLIGGRAAGCMVRHRPAGERAGSCLNVAMTCGRPLGAGRPDGRFTSRPLARV